MKKAILLLVAILIAIQPVFSAVDITTIPAENQMTYMMNSLSIQAKQTTQSSASTIGNVSNWGLLTGLTVGRSDTSTEWYPYMGPNQISRGDFLRLVGQDDMARSYEEGMRKEQSMHTAGWAIFGVSLLAALGLGAGMLINMYDYNNYNFNTVYWYGIGAIGACLVGLVSIPLVSWEYNDNTSISFAVGLADIYNQRLAESLR